MVECGHNPDLCQTTRSDRCPRFCKRFPQSLYRSIVHHRIERCLYPFAAYTEKNSPATVFNEIPAGCLASDTLVWLSTTADASGLTLSFRGYARCSATMLFSLSKQTIPATLLLAALLWGGFTFSISTGTQRLMPVTGSNKKTSLPSATFRFPSRKPASITNSRKS